MEHSGGGGALYLISYCYVTTNKNESIDTTHEQVNNRQVNNRQVNNRQASQYTGVNNTKVKTEVIVSSTVTL